MRGPATFDLGDFLQRPWHQALAAPYAAGLGPLAFRVPDGPSFTFVPGETIEVHPGVGDAATVVELPIDQLAAFLEERWTRYGLLYHGTATYPNGSFDDLCRWEPVLRALIGGRAVWDPERLDLPDDLARSFTLDGLDAERAEFLQSAGYLHVRAVFSDDEIHGLRSEVDALANGATPDATTWWTRTPDGRDVVCQVKYGALRSQPIADLHDDARIRRILADAGVSGLRPNLDRNEGTKLIYKRPGASEGLTDLPLHTDCGMGYHPIACPMVLLGVHLDAGTPDSGQLHVLAGSHNTSTPDPAIVDTSGWPIVALATEVGDVTVHFGHTLHAAPAPTGSGSGRRTMYLAFAPNTLFEALAPMEDLVAAMQGAGGIPKTVDEIRA